MSGPVRTIVVAGGGIAALVAALALARAYRALGVTVTLVEPGGGEPNHAALAGGPDIRGFHRLLGIDERALLATGAAFSLGQQFVGWSGQGSVFLHSYGDAGHAFAGLPFVQHWTRARLSGLRVGLEDFCLAAAAAKHGRIGLGDGGEPSLPYGYHQDARRYAEVLRHHARAAGVEIRRARFSAIAAGRAIAAVATEEGERIEADLFVDADGALLDAIDPGGATPRPGPCDRLITASAPPLDPLPLHARVAAHGAGYVLLLPLADRTAVELAYDSSGMSDAEAIAALPALAGLPILGHDPPAPAVPGRRPRRWIGNCIGIGLAPGALDAAALLELQLAVGQLVLLLPVDREEMAEEAAIYSAELTGQADRIADFTAMHFRLNGRDEPFWSAARAAPVSNELAAKIALFKARGMFAYFDHEAHRVDSWTLCMVGHGHVPESHDPQVDRVDEREAMAQFQGQLHDIARKVRAMPTHRDALAVRRGRAK